MNNHEGLYYVFRFANNSGRLAVLDLATKKWVPLDKADPSHLRTFSDALDISRKQTVTRVGVLSSESVAKELAMQIKRVC